MSRFGDARDLRRPDEPPVLANTEDPLDELGMADGARDEQERAVRKWLADPSRTCPGFPELSARQIEILSRVVRGDAVDDIAAALYLGPSTVRTHLTAL